MSLCQSKNEVPDAATALGADAALAMCATRDWAVRGAHGWCVVEPCSSFPPRRVSPVARRPLRRRETNVNSTTVLGMDTLGRTLWVDMGWPACDERLVTVAGANALRVGSATTQLPDVR